MLDIFSLFLSRGGGSRLDNLIILKNANNNVFGAQWADAKLLLKMSEKFESNLHERAV